MRKVLIFLLLFWWILALPTVVQAASNNTDTVQLLPQEEASQQVVSQQDPVATDEQIESQPVPTIDPSKIKKNAPLEPASSTTRLHTTVIENVLAIAGTVVNFNPAGTVSLDGLTIPDLTWAKDWLNSFLPYSQPTGVAKKTDPAKGPYTASAMYRLCISERVPFGKDTRRQEYKEDVSSREYAGPVDWAPDYLTAMFLLNSSYSLGGKKISQDKNGLYNLDFPDAVIKNALSCIKNNESTPQTTTQVVPIVGNAIVPTTLNFTYIVPETIILGFKTIINQITGAIEKIAQYMNWPVKYGIWVIKSKLFFTHDTETFCLTSYCDANDTKKTPNKEEVLRNQGITTRMLPFAKGKVQEDFGNAPSSVHFVGFKVGLTEPYTITQRSEILLDRWQCIITPLAKQNELDHDATACGPPLDCPLDAIIKDYKSPPASCGLCASSYTNQDYMKLTVYGKNYTYADSLPAGIPPLMKKVLDAAGQAYNVPASMLLATMREEGAFSHFPDWLWTDENVRQYSNCHVGEPGPMPDCTTFANPQSGAKGPFGYIDYWWNQYMNNFDKDHGPYKAVYDGSNTNFANTYPDLKKVVDKLDQKTVSKCNFVDSAFMAARELGVDQSHLYVPGTPKQCTIGGGSTSSAWNFGTLIGSSGGVIPIYQGGDPPRSCSDWNSSRAALARYQYDDRLCDTALQVTVKTFDTMTCH